MRGGQFVGVEVLAAAVVAYLIRKAARVGRRADQEVDRVLDAGMDQLHNLVSGKLRGDLVLSRLEEQAAAGGATERTQRRAIDAIADAAEDDTRFASQIEYLVKALANREIAIGENPPGAVQNLISGGSQQGVVIMGRDISHVTVHHPAPPSGIKPGSEEDERQERAMDAAYRKFLATLPSYSHDTVALKRIRRNVYKPERSAYFIADVNEMLSEIRKLIAARDLNGLSGYLAAISLSEVTECSQPDIPLTAWLRVRVYLDRLRDALRDSFTEEDPQP